MALTIEGATVGYDVAGVQKLLVDIKTQVIEEASKKMKSSLSTLNAAVDEVWAGHSADTFKKNMKTDVNSICNALDKTYDALYSEVNQIIKAMGQVDQNLVKKRK